MEVYDFEKLRGAVREICNNTVNPRTRATYLNLYTTLNKQPFVPDAFIQTIGRLENYTEQPCQGQDHPGSMHHLWTSLASMYQT
ncbi:hypothetical protein PHMEG_00031390 [Phytophthora megakarya]|uniref:Uncharacterized protein n=1 Tax=Phytophthora megakarya TaxID=4795 RepID=A0A225UYE6_9STRA|nr:hypothetical protein PHMEG_00031390 [Phytophthora megakarya]